jgi:hypothetical protein
VKAAELVLLAAPARARLIPSELGHRGRDLRGEEERPLVLTALAGRKAPRLLLRLDRTLPSQHASRAALASVGRWSPPLTVIRREP